LTLHNNHLLFIEVTGKSEAMCVCVCFLPASTIFRLVNDGLVQLCTIYIYISKNTTQKTKQIKQTNKQTKQEQTNNTPQRKPTEKTGAEC
jgi:hypothetical protein